MGGDRRLIRVDGLPDQAGIAAALRRAFAAGRQDDVDQAECDSADRGQRGRLPQSRLPLLTHRVA